MLEAVIRGGRLPFRTRPVRRCTFKASPPGADIPEARRRPLPAAPVKGNRTMLLSKRPTSLPESPLEQLHNYYEHRVIDALRARKLSVDDDTFVDIACIALNELPAKYIRYEVDMAYFSDPVELAAMNAKIERAVDLAIGRVASVHWSRGE